MFTITRKKNEMKKMILGLVACSVFGSANSFADETEKETKTESRSESVQIRLRSTTESNSDDEDDVEVTSSVSGKIVIVGPDGKKQEFELGDQLPEGLTKFNLSGKNNLSMFLHGTEQMDESRYMIGVMCEPATEVLRSHLHLGERGLVVTSVSEEMPAADAGLQQGDILLSVGDTEISSLEGLVKAVGASDGSAMTFSVIQKGEKKEIEIAPKKSSTKLAIGGLPEGLQELVLENADNLILDIDAEELHNGIKNAQNEARRMIIRRIGPGFRISDDVGFDVEEFVMDQEVEASEKGLQKQMKAMRKRLAEMEKKLESFAGEEE